jgi:hypothetical protein
MYGTMMSLAAVGSILCFELANVSARVSVLRGLNPTERDDSCSEPSARTSRRLFTRLLMLFMLIKGLVNPEHVTNKERNNAEQRIEGIMKWSSLIEPFGPLANL